MAVIGYTRVSTGEQDAESQRLRLYDFAKERKLKVTKWVQETVSSRKRKQDREVTRMVESLRKGDLVLVTELSRLARSSVTEVAALVEAVRDKGAGLFVVSEGIEIQPGKRPSLRDEAVLSALSLAARIERDMVSERTKAGLKAAREGGKQLGRPRGSSKLREHEAQIQEWRKLRISKASMAKLLGVSRSTLYDYLSAEDEKGHATEKGNAR